MKTLKEIRAPKIKKGLRDKKGKLHTVDMKLDGSKLSFRVTDEFGSFKTVNAKGLARMFEGTDVEKFIEEASFWGQDKMSAKAKAMMSPKTHVRLTREKGGYERATVSKKDKKKIAQLKKDGYKIDPTFAKEEIEESVDEAMNPKDKAKRLKMIKKAVERINKGNAEKAKKDALRMMKDSGMFDESVEITEGKQSYVDQMRDIVAKKSAKKINGVMVDMFTASAVVKVYDAINDTNKAKMDKMTVPAMANVAFKLMKK